MAYEAQVFNVMIASPGDVQSERAIIRDVIYEWNAVHSHSRKIVLLPTGWETHSSPEMGQSAQDIINEQILVKCDLMIGVFWTRIGTQTTAYLSGTVEEIEKHIDAGGPTRLYFSSQPVAMDTVDMTQVSKLTQFKDSCKGKGLYESYDSYSDFRNKLYRQLQIKINEHVLFKSDVSFVESTPLKSDAVFPVLGEYARILLKEASFDPQGTILHIRFIGGAGMQTNGKELMASSERREMSKWEGALEELVQERLIVSRGSRNETYELTNLGYQYADMIQL